MRSDEEILSERLSKIRAFKKIKELPEWEMIRKDMGTEIQFYLNNILGNEADMIKIAEWRGKVNALKAFIARVDDSEKDERQIESQLLKLTGKTWASEAQVAKKSPKQK